MADTRRAFGAPRAKLIADGNKVFAWATGITVVEQITNVPVKVLGDVYTQELVAVDVSVSVTVDAIHITDQSLVKTGVYAQGTSQQIVEFPELTLELYDQFEDIPVARVLGCKSARRTVPLGRGGIMAESVSFDAIKFELLDAGQMAAPPA